MTDSDFEILLGAPAFMARLEADVAAACQRVLVQAMTFEADGAGLALVHALRRSAAGDRRLLVDAFTHHVINDRFVNAPLALLDRPLQREARATRRLFAALERDGIPVGITNMRVGPFMARYPLRNHKKMIIVDGDLCYIGGINFSDHNFAWHDMMIRCRDRDLAAFLTGDFDATWQGRNLSRAGRFGSGTVYSLDGGRSRSLYRPLLGCIAGARKSLYVHSPYVTPPFADAVCQAAQNGARVTVLCPGKNNKPLAAAGLAAGLAHPGIRFRRLDGPMSHLKAILVDGQFLLAGSSNFDLISYHLEQEIMVLFHQPALARAFMEKVLVPDLARSQGVTVCRDPLRRALAGRIFSALGRLFSLGHRILG